MIAINTRAGRDAPRTHVPSAIMRPPPMITGTNRDARGIPRTIYFDSVARTVYSPSSAVP
ncbi:hypothetical protein DIE06_03835 [Burkholderia sp. Bp8998]|nr:hypothetical protein DIE06_03835 [Burkholderia sp. Bp8998]